VQPDQTTIFDRTAALSGGLVLMPRDRSAAALAVAGSIAAITLFIALLDGVLFRDGLSPGYVAHFTSPLWPRMLLSCLISAIDEVQYRLLMMTGLVMALSLARVRLIPAHFIAIILIAQLANVGELVLAQPLYASLRYWAVGCVWGWLYWRHGWLAALAGHGTSHLLLDPVLMAVLRS
jgi:hypothetical protein